MDLLVVGTNGLLGSNVVAAGLDRGLTIYGTYHSQPGTFDIDQTQLDIRNEDRVRQVCATYAPSLIVNCAAMTDVDQCETNQEQARRINAEAPGILADCADSQDAGLVHVSTDYVFDGTAREPYSESATPNPLQVYGKTKLAGERVVRDVHQAPLVPRLSFVYGVHRSTNSLEGFPGWVANRLAADQKPSLFTDQYVTPTRAGFVADRILTLTDRDVTGLINITSRSCVTPYEIGRIVADIMGFGDEVLAKSRMAALDRPAERPRFSCLDTSRLAAVSGGAVPDLRSELARIL